MNLFILPQQRMIKTDKFHFTKRNNNLKNNFKEKYRNKYNFKLKLCAIHDIASSRLWFMHKILNLISKSCFPKENVIGRLYHNFPILPYFTLFKIQTGER